jgi:glycosyltransferase involved in cell wall biosynthesis
MKTILLVSPFSKISTGGIGTWTRNILDYNASFGKYNLIHQNTSFNLKSNIITSNFIRILQGLLDSSIIISMFIVNIFKYKPNTIHYTSSGSYALIKDLIIVLISRMFKKKIIVQWHFGRIPNLSKVDNFEWKFLKLIFKLCNQSIVSDQKTLKTLQNIKIYNVCLIPNPISISLENRANSNRELTKSLDTSNFIFVGHLIPAKGITELIKACSLVKFKMKLILIGPISNSYKKEVESFIKSKKMNDFVEFKGEIKRDEVFEYIKEANALCLPSYTEAFPNVILEAMSLRCPIIASDVGAIKEMISSTDYGNAGICIDKKNVGQLKDAINYIISNPIEAKKFGNYGNERILGKYTLSKVFPVYEHLW